jgi:hypothetical protein
LLRLLKTLLWLVETLLRLLGALLSSLLLRFSLLGLPACFVDETGNYPLAFPRPDQSYRIPFYCRAQRTTPVDRVPSWTRGGAER